MWRRTRARNSAQTGREIPTGAGDPRHAHAIQEAAGLRGHERYALLARGGRQEVDQVQPAAGAGGLHRQGLFRRQVDDDEPVDAGVGGIAGELLIP